MLDCILAGASDLGSSNATIAELIGSSDVGILISERPLELWTRLVDALDASVETEINYAKELRDKKENSLGQKLSRRALLSNSDKAAEKEKQAEVFSTSCAALRAALSSVDKARTALRAEEGRGSSAGEASESPPASNGPLSMALRELLRKNNITTQAYWAGTMVGPDARRFLQHFRDIFAELRELLVSKVGELVAAAWIARKTSTLKELDVVCHYTRAVRMLKTEEKAALKSACIAYPEAFRLAFPGRKIVPPKIHCIEKHIMPIVEKYGTIGVFGEDGLESYHPVDSRARMIVRTMRNSVERHKAMTNHINKATKARL